MTDLYAAAVDAADVEPDLEATPEFLTRATAAREVVVDEAGERKLRLVRDRGRDRDRRESRRGHVAAPVRQESLSTGCGPGGELRLHRRPRDVRQTKGLDIWGRPADIETESRRRRPCCSSTSRGWVAWVTNYDQTLTFAALLASSLVWPPGALDEARSRPSDSSCASRGRSRRTKPAATPTICPPCGCCATSRWNSSTRTATTSTATSTSRAAFVGLTGARAMNTGSNALALEGGGARRCRDRTRLNPISAPTRQSAAAAFAAALAD